MNCVLSEPASEAGTSRQIDPSQWMVRGRMAPILTEYPTAGEMTNAPARDRPATSAGRSQGDAVDHSPVVHHPHRTRRRDERNRRSTVRERHLHVH